MIAFLSFCAAHARALLVLGLLGGIALPGLANAMQPWLPQMVAALLMVSAFRIGARAAFGALSDLRWAVLALVILQLAVPLGIIAGMALLGLLAAPLTLALVMASTAPTISGGVSQAIILRQDPARVMQMLILGTALFPLTVLPVLGFLPQTGTPMALATAALRSLAVILGAGVVGFSLRHWLLRSPNPDQLRAADGAAILGFVIIVVGLMAALGPMLRNDPVQAAGWMLAAFVLSFGLQTATMLILRRTALSPVAGPLALVAGNRNIALFLVALPAEVTAPVMIFIACWQLPMYLTPIILPRLYKLVPDHV